MSKNQDVNDSNILEIIYDKVCHVCKVYLTVENVDKHQLKRWFCICKPCQNTRNKKVQFDIKLKTMNEYGGKCACCGETGIIFLTINHIDDNGAIHRENLFGSKHISGSRFYRWLKNNNYPKDNYQVLCFNCNFAKHVMGRCPHQDNKSK